MKNYYPDKPVIPFRSVSVEMGTLIAAIKDSGLPAEVQRAAYILIRNETGNGKSVVNGTNPGGVQSDSGAWPDKWNDSIVATSVKEENRTGNLRGFVVFDTLQTGVKFMCERIQARGLFIGGTTKKITQVTTQSKEDLAVNYYREWVEGDAKYKPTEDEIDDFVAMYRQAEKIFA